MAQTIVESHSDNLEYKIPSSYFMLSSPPTNITTIYEIGLFDTHGICLLKDIYHNKNTLENEIESGNRQSDLESAFLSAINSFGHEVYHSDLKNFSLTDDRVISFFKFGAENNYILGVVYDQDSNNHQLIERLISYKCKNAVDNLNKNYSAPFRNFKLSSDTSVFDSVKPELKKIFDIGLNNKKVILSNAVKQLLKYSENYVSLKKGTLPVNDDVNNMINLLLLPEVLEYAPKMSKHAELLKGFNADLNANSLSLQIECTYLKDLLEMIIYPRGKPVAKKIEKKIC